MTPRLVERLFWPCLMLLALAAMTVAAWARSGVSLSVDEPFTALAVSAFPAGFLETLRHDNTPVTYLALWAWTSVVGDSELALRSVMLVAFGAAVLVTGAAGRRVGGAGCGLLAALLVGSSASVGLVHAAMIRPYALLILIGALVVWTLAADLGTQAAPRWTFARLAVLHLVGLFTHPVYVFLVVACSGAAWLVAGRRRTVITAAGVAALAAYLVGWGWMLADTAGLPATAWMESPRPRDLVNAYLLIWGNRNGFVLLGVVLALASVRRWPSLAENRAVFVATAAGAAAVILSFGVSWIRPVFHLTRTTAMVLPFVSLSVAFALTTMGNWRVIAPMAGLVGVGAIQYLTVSVGLGDTAPTRASVAAILEQADCGDTLVLTGLSYAPVVYYLQRLDPGGCLTPESFPREVAAHPGWFDSRRFEDERAIYRDEALAITRRASESRGRVYVFLKADGIGAETGPVILAAMDAVLTPAATFALQGAFFDHVRVYAPPGSPATP